MLSPLQGENKGLNSTEHAVSFAGREQGAQLKLSMLSPLQGENKGLSLLGFNARMRLPPPSPPFRHS